jgi:hypothetical protein
MNRDILREEHDDYAGLAGSLENKVLVVVSTTSSVYESPTDLILFLYFV